MTPGLPDELWLDIFQLTNEPSAYWNLLLTCRRFQAIAEPLLYRNVDVSKEGPRPRFHQNEFISRSRLFLNTVTSNQRLASYIETLITPDLPIAELRNTPFRNLRKLASLYPYFLAPYTGPDSSSNNAPASLTHLTHLVWQRLVKNETEFYQFLGGIPHLEYLSAPFIPDRNDPVNCPPEALTQLNFLHAHVNQVITILPGRRVQHLEIPHGFSHTSLRGLSFPSITTLATTSTGLPCLHSFPNLEYLKVKHVSAGNPSLKGALEIFRPLTCPSLQYLSVRFKFIVKNLRTSKSIRKEAYRPQKSIVAHGAFHGFPALRVIDITLEWSPDEPVEILRYTLSENGLFDSDPMEMAQDDSENRISYWETWWTSSRFKSAALMCSSSTDTDVPL
ncbi:hypothetical protein ONZ45_g10187 [Pleurotus djamor]|nr:hypothetical protein ONZ45_g10187 [Pleurotus djamor]